MHLDLSVYLLLAKSKIINVDWSVEFVILSVCLSVCLFVACRSRFQTDLHETSPHGRVYHKEEAYCF